MKKSLLIAPNPESALNEEAGRLFQENYEQYEKRCKLFTNIHATKKKEIEKNNENEKKIEEKKVEEKKEIKKEYYSDDQNSKENCNQTNIVEDKNDLKKKNALNNIDNSKKNPSKKKTTLKRL
jgi:hypothetical protein